MIYFIIIAAIVVADQLTKLAVVHNMFLGESIPVLGDFFHLTRIHNTGAAFNTMEGIKILLVFLPAVVIVGGIILIIKKRNEWDKMVLVTISVVLAGGIGNLIDRIFRGYVVDFMDFGFFPVFNIADMAVTCGCIFLLIYVFFLEKRRKQK